MCYAISATSPDLGSLVRFRQKLSNPEVRNSLSFRPGSKRYQRKKVSGTVAGTARRVLRTTVPDTFLNQKTRPPGGFWGLLRTRMDSEHRRELVIGLFGVPVQSAFLTAETAVRRSDLLIPKRYAERIRMPKTLIGHWTNLDIFSTFKHLSTSEQGTFSVRRLRANTV
jgi:hypothetical protein